MMQPRPFRRKRAEFPAMENAAIIVAVLLLLLFGAKRLENAAYLQNTAKASRELHRLYQLEEQHFHKTGRYSDDVAEIGFEPRTYYGVVFLLATDSIGFIARAVEAPGRDAFGDGFEGNEFMGIDQTGEVIHELQNR